jgi:6-phosphogluconolactonase (cycloisomerase 2 family)
MRRSTSVLASACVLALAATAFAVDPTGFLAQLPGHSGCVTDDGTSNGSPADCADGHGLTGPVAIALSPDGKNGYVSMYSGGVVALARDVDTGALTEADGTSACLSRLNDECTHSGLFASDSDSPHALAVAGGHVYVAGRDGNIVGIFDRNVSTGALSEHSGDGRCLSADGNDGDGSASCTTVSTLTGTQSLAVSPDGRFLYVGGYGTVGVTAFSIASDGTLTQLAAGDGCYVAATLGACTVARFATEIYDIALSPDGNTLYAVDYTDSAITAFSRDAVTGALTPIAGTGGCVVNGGVGDTGDPCTQVRSMDGPQALQVSPDGKLVTVGAYHDNAVVVLKRASDGTLSQASGTAGCVNETGSSACGTARMAQSVYGMQFSPDGGTLVAAAFGQTAAGSAIAIFDVAADGTLTQRDGIRGCVTDSATDSSGVAGTCAAGRGVLGAEGLAMTGDGKWFYATGSNDNGVAGFRLAHPPACSDALATTAFGAAVTIPVACTDADGDTVTLAGVDGPVHGSVTFSGVSATYTPAAGFSGADSFRVKGNDGLSDSAPATVSVTVGAGSPPPPSGRQTPSKLSLGAKPKRDRKLPFKFIFSGVLTPAAGTTCSGTIVVTVKHAKKTVAKKTAALSSSCKWKAVVSFKNRKKLGKKKTGKLTAKARFGGNTGLNAKASTTLTVRYG